MRADTWDAGGSPWSVRRGTPAELSSIVERLSRVARAEHIRVWLLKPGVALGDDKPLDVIARGDYRRVTQLISAVESPAVS
jgi:2-keto-3-deoxy-galactonokinase